MNFNFEKESKGNYKGNIRSSGMCRPFQINGTLHPVGCKLHSITTVKDACKEWMNIHEINLPINVRKTTTIYRPDKNKKIEALEKPGWEITGIISPMLDKLTDDQGQILIESLATHIATKLGQKKWIYVSFRGLALFIGEEQLIEEEQLN